ncbi:MAG: ATP-binding protein [Armatimonadota bacterium]|nr:ATP-binding protein [Armatimonadota bacterium]
MSFRTFEAIGDLTLRAVDVLFPIKQPPPPPATWPTYTPQPKLPPVDSFLVGNETGTYEPIYALSDELDRHVLIVGATGCGKTTLIARLFTEEILKWQ